MTTLKMDFRYAKILDDILGQSPLLSTTVLNDINVIIIVDLGMPKNFILLEDKPAHKYTTKWTQDSVRKGSLLVELAEGEARETQSHSACPLYYKIYSDDIVKLYCEPENIRQLNEEQFNLLLGVKHSLNRYKALDILDWVEKLRVGYGVNVTIPTISDPVKGIIRYIGPLPGEEGTKFGIELLVSQ